MMTMTLPGAGPVEPQLRAMLHSRLLLVLLAGLLVVDAVFLAAHSGQVIAEWQGRIGAGEARFSIEAEGGASELYEGVKAGICVWALAMASRQVGQPVYAALAAAFALALADNALALHENWGEAVAPLLPVGASAAQAIGELSFFLVAGLLILAALWVGFGRSAPGHRWLGAPFVGLLMALGGFAVVVDLVHAAVAGQRRAFDRFFGPVEDGGEMVVLSLACALAIALVATLRDARGEEAASLG